MKPKTESISELHERLRQYREKAKRHTKQEIQAFSLAIATKQYPEKCFRCFKAGLRFCKFWLNGFNCKTYERKKELEAFTQKVEALL